MEALERLDVTPACHCDECSGDARAPTAAQLARLVQANRDRLLALARRRGLAPEEAFDCVQEAFQTYLRIPQARSVGDEPDDGARLLAAIVLNGVRTRRRRNAIARQRAASEGAVDELRDGHLPADELLEHAEDQARLRRCVTTLSEVQRAVVTLRMLDEVAGERVATTLGLSPENVAVLLHRAKAALRGCMAEAERVDHD
jgi:RNA polymerase sigma-70 factor (ECF subfamily)